MQLTGIHGAHGLTIGRYYYATRHLLHKNTFMVKQMHLSALLRAGRKLSKLIIHPYYA